MAKYRDALPQLGGDWFLTDGGIEEAERYHAELDESTEIDEGNPAELGRQHRELLEILTNVNILGGGCGTDHRHVDAVFEACAVG